MGNRPFIQGNADLPPPSAAALSVTTSQTKAKPLQHAQGKQLSPNHAQSAVTAAFFVLATKFLFFSFSCKSLVVWGMESPPQIHSPLHFGFISIQ